MSLSCVVHYQQGQEREGGMIRMDNRGTQSKNGPSLCSVVHNLSNISLVKGRRRTLQKDDLSRLLLKANLTATSISAGIEPATIKLLGECATSIRDQATPHEPNEPTTSPLNISGINPAKITNHHETGASSRLFYFSPNQREVTRVSQESNLQS